MSRHGTEVNCPKSELVPYSDIHCSLDFRKIAQKCLMQELQYDVLPPKIITLNVRKPNFLCLDFGMFGFQKLGPLEQQISPKTFTNLVKKHP